MCIRDSTSLIHSTRFIDYLRVDDFKRTDAMIEYVRQDGGVFRTLPITGNSFYNRNYLPLFGIETANGFYDNRIRYFDYLSGEGFRNLFEPNIMRMANVKYVLTSQMVQHPLLRLDRDLGGAFVYRNVGFLPRAYMVHNAVVAEDDSAALRVMASADFDPAAAIVLHDGEAFRGDSTVADETVTIVENRLDRIRLSADVKSPGYLFYSGNYLPSWQAYVDGRRTPVVRCNIAMRAVYLEPGRHDVEMRYVSKWFNTGALICLVSCGIVALGVAVGLRERKVKRGDA